MNGILDEGILKKIIKLKSNGKPFKRRVRRRNKTLNTFNMNRRKEKAEEEKVA